MVEIKNDVEIEKVIPKELLTKEERSRLQHIKNIEDKNGLSTDKPNSI